MKLKVVVNNYTNDDKELKLWAKWWIEKQKSKGKKAIAKMKITN